MKIKLNDFDIEVLSDFYGDKWQKKLKKFLKTAISQYVDYIDSVDFDRCVKNAKAEGSTLADLFSELNTKNNTTCCGLQSCVGFNMPID